MTLQQSVAVNMTLQQSVAVSMTLQQSVAVSMALQQSVAVRMALQQSVAINLALQQSVAVCNIRAFCSLPHLFSPASNNSTDVRHNQVKQVRHQLAHYENSALSCLLASELAFSQPNHT
jgi:hypothetical protein